MNSRALSLLCCPYCRGELSVPSSDGRGESIEEGAAWCSQCEVAYPVKAGILNLLDHEHGGTQEVERASRDDWASEHAAASPSEVLDRISRHHYVPAMSTAIRSFAKRFLQNQWVLDLGTGWGWHWLGVTQPNVIAIDFSFESLLIARKLLGPQVDRNIHLVCGDAAQLPVKDRTVDGIWSVQALQHIPEPALERCLALCSRACKARAAIEIYWLNWSLLVRIVPRLLGKRLNKEVKSPYCLRYITGKELRDLVYRYFDGKVTIGYNEVVFHPELHLVHKMPLAWFDQAAGRIPVFNRAVARQGMARVSVGS